MNLKIKFNGVELEIEQLPNGKYKKPELSQKYNGMKYSIAPLKQTNETILVFQKPYKTGSCLHDTLAYENGDAECMCGAVDVEGNRVGTNGGCQHGRKVTNSTFNLPAIEKADYGGRYPAQTYCDDEAAKVLDRQSGNCGGHSVKTKKIYDAKAGTNTYGVQDRQVFSHNDTGGCSRILHRCNYDLNDYDIYMYCPKVSNKERNEGCEALSDKVSGSYAQDEWSRQNMGNTPDKDRKPVKNHHPTVKPISLLKKIIQLFKTPNPLHVLDPFMGSGSMGIACIELGVSYTGVELDPEYYTIAQTRLAHHNTKNNSKLF